MLGRWWRVDRANHCSTSPNVLNIDRVVFAEGHCKRGLSRVAVLSCLKASLNLGNGNLWCKVVLTDKVYSADKDFVTHADDHFA